MKKILSVVLALTFILALAPLSSLAESTPAFIQFPPNFCSMIDLSLAEWMQNEASRALLCLVALIDMSSDSCPQPLDTEEINFEFGGYVGTTSTSLLITYCMQDGRILVIKYAPDGGFAQYCIMEAALTSKTLFAVTIEKSYEENGSEYYAVSAEDLVDMAAKLQALMEEE